MPSPLVVTVPTRIMLPPVAIRTLPPLALPEAGVRLIWSILKVVPARKSTEPLAAPRPRASISPAVLKSIDPLRASSVTLPPVPVPADLLLVILVLLVLTLRPARMETEPPSVVMAREDTEPSASMPAAEKAPAVTAPVAVSMTTLPPVIVGAAVVSETEPPTFELAVPAVFIGPNTMVLPPAASRPAIAVKFPLVPDPLPPVVAVTPVGRFIVPEPAAVPWYATIVILPPLPLPEVVLPLDDNAFMSCVAD